MQIEYRRNLNKSYMIISTEEVYSGFELKMFENNSIHGFLNFHKVEKDGKTQFWYDITGKQSLDSWLEGNILTKQILIQLIYQIYETSEGIRPFLLNPEGVLLLADGIFLKNDTDTVFLCFFPPNKQELAGSFCSLMEYLLQKLDHREEDAVKIGYEIYNITQEEGYSLIDIVNYLKEQAQTQGFYLEKNAEYEDLEYAEQNSGQSDEFLAEEYVENEGGKTESRRAENRKAEIGITENRRMETGKTESKNAKKRKIKSRKKENENETNRERTISKKEDGKSNGLLRGMLKNKSLTSRKNLIQRKDDFIKEEYLILPEEKEADQTKTPTVFLGGKKEKLKGELRYVGAGQEADFKIECSPFVVGTREEFVDGFLHSEAVSRLHAKIVIENDCYYIEDLNSTNGTFVNEEEVNYKTPVALNSRDHVWFADEEYIFY